MEKLIYDYKGDPVSKVRTIPNLDPGFFIPTLSAGNISASDIAERPYQYHPWINACGRVISMNVSRLPKVLTKKDKPEEYIYEHEVLALFENPNPFMTEIVFWQAIVLGLLLPSKRTNEKGNTGGQVFLVCDSGNEDKPQVDLRKGDIPKFIYPYTDKVIRPRRDGKDRLTGWIYEVPGYKNTKIEYELDEIIRINFFNPYDWLKGMSYFSPAQIAVLQDIKADIYNTTTFDNDATIAGLLTSDQHLTPEQFEIYMKRWYEKYGGAGNSNRTAILGMGLKYQQYGLTHADMQYVEQKEKNYEQILAVHGLNRIALGNYEKLNRATIVEGRRMLWQDTYMPIDQQITVSINNQWVRNIDNFRLRSDYSGIEALREDYGNRAKAGGTMVKDMDFPPALAARLNNIPLTDQNLTDYPWLNEKPEQKAPGGFAGAESLAPIISTKGVEVGEDERMKLSWDYIHKVLDPGEKKFKAQLERFFNSQRNRMQDRVDFWLKQQERAIKIMILDPKMFLLNFFEENEALAKLIKPLVIDQLKRETARIEQELGELIEWNVTDERIGEFIKARQNEIKEINSTTFKKAHKKIGAAIEEAIKENATPQQAAKLIKSAISDVGEVRKNQSLTIARTETGIISSSTRFKAFHIEGIEYGEWLTAGDEGVRSNHRKAGEAGILPIGQKYPYVNMRFPLDPEGAVGEIVNCRCVLLAAEKEKK